MVRPEGIEPPTKSLEGSCSIRLSYERTLAENCRQTGHVRRVLLLMCFLHHSVSLSSMLS